jgi:putative GTP pyrophosphokinase
MAPRPRSWAHREAQAYRRRRREYVAATTALVTWLQARLEDVDEIEAFVSGRAKEVRSVEQKLRARERAEPGRDAGYADLPDLIGVRVVVRLESEIAVVADELHRLLLVDKDVDARDERGREETPGYRGRHFDVRARPGTAELPELLASQPAEIQVRTRAADVWASLEHELRYKGTAQLPPARSRQFVLAASLLELAERELEDLRAWQLDTQRALQLADLPRQRRLRDVQALGGATETQLLRHGDEVAQLPQVDRPVHAEKVLHKSQFPQTGLLRTVRAANERLRWRRWR